jgi:hypothetical protein
MKRGSCMLDGQCREPGGIFTTISDTLYKIRNQRGEHRRGIKMM